MRTGSLGAQRRLAACRVQRRAASAAPACAAGQVSVACCVNPSQTKFAVQEVVFRTAVRYGASICQPSIKQLLVSTDKSARTCTAAMAEHCVATTSGSRLSLGAQGSIFTTGTGEAASNDATAAGAAAHSCCSSSICSGALAPPAADNSIGPDAVAAPPCSGSGAVPAAAQCCSTCGGSRLRPKSAGGSAGAPAAAAVLDRPELPLPRPAVQHGTWNVDGTHLHPSPAD